VLLHKTHIFAILQHCAFNRGFTQSHYHPASYCVQIAHPFCVCTTPALLLKGHDGMLVDAQLQPMPTASARRMAVTALLTGSDDKVTTGLQGDCDEDFVCDFGGDDCGCSNMALVGPMPWRTMAFLKAWEELRRQGANTAGAHILMTADEDVEEEGTLDPINSLKPNAIGQCGVQARQEGQGCSPGQPRLHSFQVATGI